MIELDVSYNHVYGSGSLTISSLNIKDDLETEVNSEGFWLWMYTGHSNEFSLINFKNKDDADELISDLSVNEYTTSIFIVSDI